MLFDMARPATIRNAKAAIVWLRVLSSLAWIDSAFVGKDAKIAPSFIHGDGLRMRIEQTFVHTALDPRVSHVLTTIVAPHAALCALLIALADATAGISLALGLFTRVGALIAIARAAVNILVAGGAGTDTIGYNAMLIVAAALCLSTAAGRKAGIDRVLIDRSPKTRLWRTLG